MGTWVAQIATATAPAQTPALCDCAR